MAGFMEFLVFGAEIALLLGCYTTLGLVVLKVLSPEEEESGFIFYASAFVTGLFIVSFLAYYLSASFGMPVKAFTLLPIVLCIATPLYILFRRLRCTLPSISLKRNLLTWLCAAVVFLVYFQSFPYDQAVSAFCMKQNIHLLIEPPASGYLLRTIVGDQREGGPAFAAAIMGFFSDPLPGAKVAASICGLCIFAFTYGAVIRILQQKSISTLAAVCAAFHPFLFRMPGLDENLISLATTSFVLYLLFSPSPALLPLAGFCLAYAFGIRHEGILFLPAVLWFISKKFGAKPLLRFLIPFGVGIAPVFLRHWVAMGSPLAYEALLEYSRTDNKILARLMDALSDYLNFPFYHMPVRTPHNPYPGLLLHYLNFLAYSGLIYSAFTLLGLFASLRFRKLGLFLLFWTLPGLVLFMLIENWDYPSKWSIPLVLMNAPFIFFAIGVHFVLQHWRNIALVCLIGICLAATQKFIRTLKETFVSDPRYTQRFPCIRPERKEVLDFRSEFLEELRLLPVTDWLSLVRNVAKPPSSGASWSYNPGGPWFSPNALEWIKNETSQRNAKGIEAVVLLAKDPARPLEVIKVTENTCTPGDKPFTVEGKNLLVPWAPEPAHISISWWPHVAILWLKMSSCVPNRIETFCYTCSPRFSREQDNVGQEEHADREPIFALRHEDLQGYRICLPVPTLIVFSEFLVAWADLALFTEILLEESGLRVLGQTIPVRN